MPKCKSLVMAFTVALVLSQSACTSSLTNPSPSPTNPSPTKSIPTDCGRVDRIYDTPDYPITITPTSGTTLRLGDTISYRIWGSLASANAVGEVWVREDDGQAYIPELRPLNELLPLNGCPVEYRGANILLGNNGVYLHGKGGHWVDMYLYFFNSDGNLDTPTSQVPVILRSPALARFFIE